MSGRALVITPRFPWPLDDGGRIGLFQAVWSVSRSWPVILATLVGEEDEATPLPPQLAGHDIEVIRVRHRPPSTPRAVWRGTFGRWPYTMERFRNTELDAVLRHLAATRDLEFVYYTGLHLATYRDALEGVPGVMRAQNAEALWMSRYAESVRQPAVRAFAKFQARRLDAAERELCAAMDLILAVQDHERELLRALHPAGAVETVPIGIDFGRFATRAPSREPTILVTGTFGWAPNAAGLTRFLEAGWDTLRARHPRARLRIVGKGPDDRLRSAARRPGVDVVGYVSAIEPEFAGATLLLVPLWVGAGARVKIVEAFAAGTPVVSTSLGAEGLGVTPGEHAAIAETPEALAVAAADLLDDPARAARLGAAGRAFAHEHFSLDAVADLTARLIRGALGARRGCP